VSDATQTGGSHAPVPTPSRRIRAACHDDVDAIAAAVAALLDELAGRPGISTSPADATPRDLPAMRDTARTLIGSPAAGAIFVAEAAGALVGALASSWQLAIHVPGAYALIQDLWVAPGWRGQGIGAGLIEAIVELAGARGVGRVEVGLPREEFAGFAATEAFYRANGFDPNGPRMRRLLG
jgi:GNAT superfamily N-acetyltransferase